MHSTTRKVLSTTRKDRPVTVKSAAKSAGIEVQVARRHLDSLVEAGTLIVEGVKNTGKRGRPSKLYRRAA